MWPLNIRVRINPRAKLRKPKAAIPGTGFSGVVVGIGDEVEKFKLDDQVFGEAGLNFGAHAEYLCVPEDGVVDIKPPTLSFQDACTLCDGPMTSYIFLLRMAKTAPGQTVLINGASGALGTAAVQLPKRFINYKKSPTLMHMWTLDAKRAASSC